MLRPILIAAFMLLAATGAKAAPARIRLFVQKREAFTAKTKLSGVSSRHLRQLSGLKVE